MLTTWSNQAKQLYTRAEQKLYGLSKHTLRRADNPYATHMPVLAGLARLFPIRRVIEFGSGEYSTLTFLNRATFPDLEALYSYENDPEWAQRIASQIKGDARATLTVVEGAMHEHVPTIEDWGTDLIFIDDSLTATDRAATIRAVAAHAQPASLIAIHDFEVLDYRQAAQAWPRRFVFSGYTPHVGLLWRHKAPAPRNKLRALDKLIAAHADSLAPDDVAGWLEVFAGWR